MKKVEHRASGQVTEENAEKRHFAARVLTYGPVDQHGTTWAPGVFTESLEARKPAAVWSHQANRPIGRVIDYRDSAEGLDMIIELADFDAVPDAKMAHALLKQGVIDNFSFGFYREKEEDDPNHRGATRITKASMVEVSPVLEASGQGTRTLAVRSTTRAAATDLLNKVVLGEIDAQEALALLAEMRETPTIEVRSKEDLEVAAEKYGFELREKAQEVQVSPEAEARKKEIEAELRAIDEMGDLY